MAAPPDADAQLMLRVKRGDAAAFAVLVEKYQQPILNLVARTLRDPVEAEDLAQIVFVQTWKSAGRYQASAKFSTWLFTIARNLCLNELRRRAGIPPNRWTRRIRSTRAKPCISRPTRRPRRPPTRCCTASWSTKSRKLSPRCRKTSALPCCSASGTS